MALTKEMIVEYASLLPSDMSWAAKRRAVILHFWPDPDVRAAEQDARNGNQNPLLSYDADVATIKNTIQKGE